MGELMKVSLVHVQDSRTMGAILGKNTFEFSSRIMDDDRSSQKTLISEGMMARGRPLCHTTPPPSPQIPLFQFYLSFVTCSAKNVESAQWRFQSHKQQRDEKHSKLKRQNEYFVIKKKFMILDDGF